MESSGKWEKKEKWEDGDIWVYVCGGEKSREKKKEKKRMNDRKEERKKNDNLEILPQYFHNKF